MTQTRDNNKRITFLNTLFSNKKILLEFILIFSLILVISLSAYSSLTSLIEKSVRVNETRNTINSINTLNIQILNSEIKLHHFVLSNISAYFNEYKASHDQIYSTLLPSLQKQIEVSEDKDKDLVIFETLKTNIDKEFLAFEEVITLEEQKNVSEATIASKLEESERIRKDVQTNFDTLNTLEDEELRSQDASASSQAINTINIIRLSIGFIGGIAIIGFLFIIFDQMKKRKLERQLFLSEEKYRLIFERVQDIYYKTNLAGKIILISPSVEKYLGLTSEQVVGTNVSKLYVNPNDRESFMNALKLSGSVVDYPLALKDKDGKIVYSEVSSHLVYDIDHKPIGVEGIVRDVSIRKKAEDALKRRTEEVEEQKNLFLSLINNSPVGVFVVKAPQGEPIIMNNAGLAILGRKFDDSLSKERYTEFFNLVKEDGSLYPNQELPTVISLEQGKLVTKNDIFIQRTNGSKIALKVTSAPILDEEGKVAMSITVFEDITQEKEIDKMKTDFISITSHQLRSPLVATRWLLEMLKDNKIGNLNPDQKKLVKDIESSNNRMIDLVNIFLNISRIETGRMMINPTPTDFKVFLGEIQKELENLIQENKLNFIVNIDDNLPIVDLDQKLVKEVYTNLLSNAIKYSPQGSNIILSVEIKDGDVISKISDQGYGIPMQEQHNVFNKFFRAENVITKFPYGNGLGLYLAKAIVEISGGKIGFESAENKGTTFWFTLPLRGVTAKKGEVTISPSAIQ